MDFISSSSKGQGNHGLRRRGTSSPPHSEVQLESFCFNRRACSLLWGCSCTHIPLGKENKHQENKAALQSQPRLLSSALYSRAGTVLTHSRSSCTLPLGWALTVLSSLTNLLTPPGLALLFASYSEMSIKKKKKNPSVPHYFPVQWRHVANMDTNIHSQTPLSADLFFLKAGPM